MTIHIVKWKLQQQSKSSSVFPPFFFPSNKRITALIKYKSKPMYIIGMCEGINTATGQGSWIFIYQQKLRWTRTTDIFANQKHASYNQTLEAEIAATAAQFFDFECFTSQSMTVSILVEFLQEIIQQQTSLSVIDLSPLQCEEASLKIRGTA